MELVRENKKSVFVECERNLTKKTLIIEFPKNSVLEFKNFQTFMAINRGNIYRGFIELFHEIKKTGRENFILRVKARIDNFNWEKEFVVDKSQAFRLNTEILDYFQEIEDYETCQEITDLYRYFFPE